MSKVERQSSNVKRRTSVGEKKRRCQTQVYNPLNSMDIFCIVIRCMLEQNFFSRSCLFRYRRFAMASKDFERFYESCFDNSFGIIRDGVDRKAILNLQGEERREAESLLLQALGTTKDIYSRPVIALGLLGSKEAVEPLKKRLIDAVGIDRVQTALALFRIEKFPEAEKIIIECLRGTGTNTPDEGTRWVVVEILPFLGQTEQVVHALLEAMAEDNMVGYSAAGGLRTLFIEDEPVRNLLGQILLSVHDVHKQNFVGRPQLVQQATELIRSRLKE